MLPYFEDYFWKNGLPIGISPCDHTKTSQSYRIISDPYQKWISIEKYNAGKLNSIIYDSQLLDFRSLTTLNQTAWQKEEVEESETTLRCLIRDQNDRTILFENYTFEKGICCQCTTTSVHGILVCLQKIYHQHLGDPFNGVVLFDAYKHPVMKKLYQIDGEDGTFTQLLSEEWDGQKLQ